VQHVPKPVRYYITNQDDDQPVVRSVPVSVTTDAAPIAPPAPAIVSFRTAQTRSSGRTRMARLVRATIRRTHEPS
jgi:hypothetical protein